MIETIEKDFLEAYKAKNEVALSVLRMLKSAIGNKKIEKKVESLPDEEVITIIRKEIKQRRDAADQYRSGERADLAEKEKAEIPILEKYLPAQLGQEEIEKAVAAVIAEIQPNGMKDFGKIMSGAMQKLAGQADGSMVSEVVKQKLQNG